MNTISEKPELAKPEIDQVEIGGFVSGRVCARCFGDLRKAPGTKTFMWAIECPTCGDAWNFTTVSRKYAENLGQQALAEIGDATKRFADLLPAKPKRSKEQIMSELGF